jgi:hypothetical protein
MPRPQRARGGRPVTGRPSAPRRALLGKTEAAFRQMVHRTARRVQQERNNWNLLNVGFRAPVPEAG